MNDQTATATSTTAFIHLRDRQVWQSPANMATLGSVVIQWSPHPPSSGMLRQHQ
jgi:hypothetical protein